MSKMITLSIILIFLSYFTLNINDFSILLEINPVYLSALAIVNVLMIISNGIFMKWSIALFGKRINIQESIRVALVSTAGNFFAPAGSGLGFRAIYLKKKHNLAYSDYLSVVFCNYVIAFFINALIGLTALYYLRSSITSLSFDVLTIILVALLITTFSAFFVRVKNERKSGYKNKLLKRIYHVMVRIARGWQLMLAHKNVMIALFIITLINTVLMILATYFMFGALNIYMTLPALVLFSVLGALSIFINVTPGNLGVRESIYLLFSATVGLSAPEILSASVVDRVVMFLVLFILWSVYGRKIYNIRNPGLSRSKE